MILFLALTAECGDGLEGTNLMVLDYRDNPAKGTSKTFHRCPDQEPTEQDTTTGTVII